MKKVFNISLTLLFLLVALNLNAQELTIMSYNTKSFEGMNDIPENMFDLEKYAREFRKFNPDIICFQELETHTSRQGSREMLTELGRLLGMYPYFGYSYDKEKSNYGYYGNGILSKYPIVNTFSEQLYYNPSRSHDQRSYQYIDVLIPDDKNTGNHKLVRIVNTHLDHNNNAYDGLRPLHAKHIVDNALVNDIPTLITGDMNDWQGSKTMDTFFGVCDAMCDALDDRSLGTYLGVSKIDYIISYPQGAWERVSYTVDYENEESDHYPLISVVRLK